MTAVDMTRGNTRRQEGIDGWTDYVPWFLNVSGMLGRWFSSGDDLWAVRLEIQGVAGADTSNRTLDGTTTGGGGRIGGTGRGTDVCEAMRVVTRPRVVDIERHVGGEDRPEGPPP